MIVGIGTDIVHIPRVKRIYMLYGQNFMERILSSAEQKLIQSHSCPYRYIASRFAVKEACAKALGTGFRDGLAYSHVEVTSDALGKPSVTLYKRASELAADRKITQAHVSISDEVEYAVAFVILESIN